MRISLVKNWAAVGVLLFLLAGISFAGFNGSPATTLQLISVFPSAGATHVGIDTPLRFTFDGPPMLSQSGAVQIVDDAGMIVDSIDVSSRTLSKTIGGLPNFNYYLSKQQTVTQHPALFLVGDSLMNTGSGTEEVGPWGYGAELIPMFDPAKIHVYNEGKGGRSSRGYREEGLWQSLLLRMTPGDWVIMQFGHNDAANSQNYPDRISGKGNGDELSEVNAPGGMKRVHSYGWYLRQYVQNAAEKGVKVVILSPVPRNQWADGKIRRGFDGYVQWAAEAAKAGGAFYVDLNARAADRYDALGQQAAAQMFNDLQHTRKSGAKINAESVVAGLKQLKDCPLAAFLVKDPTLDASEKKQ